MWSEEGEKEVGEGVKFCVYISTDLSDCPTDSASGA